MQENCTSSSMWRGERRVMVHSANGHRTRKGGNGGGPPDLHTTTLALHSSEPGHGRPASVNQKGLRCALKGRRAHFIPHTPEALLMRLTVARLRRVVKADLPIEFVPQQLTSYGGLELLRRYFRLLGLHRRIRQAFSGYALGGAHARGRLITLMIG